MFKFKLPIQILFIVMLLSSCTTSDSIKNETISFEKSAQTTRDKLNIDNGDNNLIQKSYIKVIRPIDAILNKKITNISINQTKLRNALSLVFPEAYVITEGDKVNLDTTFNISANNITNKEYLELISSLSGYKISLEKHNKIIVSAVAYRRWNVASLVSMPQVSSNVGSNAKAGDAANSSNITIEKDDDVWADLLTGIKTILGDNGIVVDNRRLGEIYASGDHDKLILADQWMKKIVESSTKQVLLDVAILEVTLTDSEAKGIDWSAIYTKSANQSYTINRNAPQTLESSGAWDLVANYISGKRTLNFMVNLLKKYGKVSIQHQPSLTVTNGSTAYLGASDKISYIKSVNQEITPATDNSAAVIATTVETEEINIGVNIAVTARILADNNILIEVVPVISSLQGIDTLSYSLNEQQTLRIPRIALQELSTQVITKSGQPVHLGGLVIEKLSKAAANTPKPLGKILNFLIDSTQNSIEKREILLIITPTEV